MKVDSNLNISIEGFRAVNKAEISIDGITVLAGENGSGKSTISKLIYSLYRTIDNYERIVSENMSYELEKVYTVLRIGFNDLLRRKGDRMLRNEFLNELEIIGRDYDFLPEAETVTKLNNLITKFQIAAKFDDNELDLNILKRFNYIVSDVVQIKGNESLELGELFDRIKLHVENLYKESVGYKKSRTINLFKNELLNLFHTDILPKKFTVTEFGQDIVSFAKSKLSIPYVIQNVIYIDTPMILGVETFDNSHWEDLNEIIKKSQVSNFNNSFSRIISSDIIGGEADYDDSYLSVNNYTFRRKDDGSIFNLLDCATGVKAFSIIQLLIKAGAINDKTLLIIDEPESHLHPQWIIEYARLIVLMNKLLGVKFLIASHNPDMVSAIKIIGEKQGVLGNINYYLSKPINTGLSYDFECLGSDIDKIFSSFNIAFDRMNMYGGE